MKIRFLPLLLLCFIIPAACVKTTEPAAQEPLATPELATPTQNPMDAIFELATQQAAATLGNPMLTDTPLPIMDIIPGETLPTATWAPGDLGYGQIFGYVTDAQTGAPLPFVTVVCEQFSYSHEKCNARVTTEATGFYSFDNVKFSENDEFFLFFAASGYQPQMAQLRRINSTTWQMSVALFPAQPMDIETPTPIGLTESETPIIMCTPPLCAIGTSEVYACPNGDCPGGCGTTCATYTPTP